MPTARSTTGRSRSAATSGTTWRCSPGSRRPTCSPRGWRRTSQRAAGSRWRSPPTRGRARRASRRIAAAEVWPQAEATGSYTRERTSKNGLSVGGAGKVFNLFQAGFDANWEVDVFGGNRRAVEAADASVEAAEDDRNAFLVSLMGEVGLEYVTYRSLQQRIALANQNLAAQQGTVDLT